MDDLSDFKHASALITAQGGRVLLPMEMLLHRIQPTPDFHVDHAHHYVVVLVDSETTGNDPLTAEAIQVGLIKVAIDRQSDELLAVLGEMEGRQEPKGEISPEATRVHGLTREDLAGQRFDHAAIERFCAGANFLVAHNAPFDRTILEHEFPFMQHARWVCSVMEVDWKSRGMPSKALEVLAFKNGFVFDGHDALTDTRALALVLSSRVADLPPAWGDLARAAREHTVQIVAVKSPFEKKDRLKERRYWFDGDQATYAPAKAWISKTIPVGPRLAEELQWLRANIYGGRAAYVVLLASDATSRHSGRARPMQQLDWSLDKDVHDLLAHLNGEIAPIEIEEEPPQRSFARLTA